MNFHFSKSKFVAAATHCDKYAWLDKYKPEQKAPVDAYTQSLFDNGHKVGALAQTWFCADVDVTCQDENGKLDLGAMIRETERHMKLGTPVIAEASFDYCGFFCSVDILIRNPDGSYDLCEVKSSKQEKLTKSNPTGVKEKYILDAAYQQFVLAHCGVKLRKVFVVLLAKDYVRGATLELDKYFVKCDVTTQTAARQPMIADKLTQLGRVLKDPAEPASEICKNCNKCDYFGYCGKAIPSPSVFEIYDLDFSVKCQYYHDKVGFYDVPKVNPDLKKVARLQIAFHDRTDIHVNVAGIREFLQTLVFPLYSLDFETYQAVVPEYPGMQTYEQVPFQYSLHRIAKPDPDIEEGSPDLEACGFLDLSGKDPRRAIAESLVQNLPFGACVVAYHHSTEKKIIERLAGRFSDLAPHLLSFTYRDPLEVFQAGHYYIATMGGSLSLKSVSPALYPDDPDMDYHNLEGDIKNGTQGMNAILKVKDLTETEREKLRQDLEAYCALDTLAVVKILKEFYRITDYTGSDTEENKYRTLTPEQYICRLFDDTADGRLEITYYPHHPEPPYTRTYGMDWTEADRDAMVQRYQTLTAMLTKFGKNHAELADEERRKALLTPEELLVWQTYICPFEPFAVEESVISELYFRAEYDSLDEAENELLERHAQWRETNSLKRLPYLRCSPSAMILRAQRYERLVSWNAPEVVLQEEGRCLAEEILLYHCGPQQTQEE